MSAFEIHCFCPQQLSEYDVPSAIIPLDAKTLSEAYPEARRYCDEHIDKLGNKFYLTTAFSPVMVWLYMYKASHTVHENWFLEYANA